MKRIILSIIGLIILTLSSCSNDETKIYETIEEEIIIGENSDWPLKGKLSLPKGVKKKVPAVVLIHGSGPSDMDERVHAYTPFKDIAKHLSSEKIAVLRFDKRTFVYPKKIVENISNFTVKEEVIDDAVLAIDFLKNDKRINVEKIFLLGHSLGGMLAPRIASVSEGLAGLIILAGSPRRFSDIWYDQAKNEIEKLSDAEKEIAQNQIDEYMSYFNQFKNMTDAEAKKYFLLGASGYYYKDLDNFPANEFLKNMEVPILIMQGEKDFQVFTDKDFGEYKNLLNGKNNVSFKLYSNLNHFFIESISQTVDEYKIENNVSIEVLKDISNWLKTN